MDYRGLAGKTSLVAAMAKYLNFDVYKLKLTDVVKTDFDLRRLILDIMDSSINLVEDIDLEVCFPFLDFFNIILI